MLISTGPSTTPAKHTIVSFAGFIKKYNVVLLLVPEEGHIAGGGTPYQAKKRKSYKIVPISNIQEARGILLFLVVMRFKQHRDGPIGRSRCNAPHNMDKATTLK